MLAATDSRRATADDSRRRCGARAGIPDGGEEPRSPTPSCGATSATPPTSFAASARWSSARKPTGRQLREAGQQIKAHVLRHLDSYLQQFEEHCTRAGGHVHWAADADEANRIIVDIIRARGESEIIKVKTMTSDETRLNVALEAAGISPYETDLADLIIQLGDGSAVAHRGAGAAPQPRRDSRHLPADDAARASSATSPRTWRRRRGNSCARSSSACRSASAAPIRGRRHRRRSAWWSRRATAGCA